MEEVEFYKFLKPKESHRIPPDTEYYGETHRGFIVAKDSEMFLWSIKTLEDGAPPSDLRGKYTNKQLAIDHIDSWLEEEKKKQLKGSTVGEVVL